MSESRIAVCVQERTTSRRGGTPEEVFPLLSDSSRLLHQYVLVSEVGNGGMGSVWKAWDTKLARWVAVKFLNSPDDTAVRRFRREAQMAARLRHPNIAAVHETNEVQGLHFLVMDYIDGTPIGAASLPLRPLIETFIKVCRAVDYAHRNEIVHRDLSPRNILIGSDGEPVVTDFGLAKLLDSESSISISGMVLGTPAFMSPEQAIGRLESIDARCDVYSLGATLYYLLTGHPPFEAESPMALLYRVTHEDPAPLRARRPEIPAALEEAVLKAMRRDKDHRTASAAELGEELRRFLDAPPNPRWRFLRRLLG